MAPSKRINRDEVRRLHALGLKNSEIAKSLNCSADAMVNILQGLGLRSNGRIKATDEQIIEAHGLGLSNRSIEEKLGIGRSGIVKHLKRLNLVPNVVGFVNPLILKDDALEKAMCNKCNETYPISYFQVNRKGQASEYRFGYCNSCRKKQSYAALSRNPEAFLGDRHNRLMIRAKNSNILCTITREELIGLWYRQQGLCFYTDIPMIVETGRKLQPDATSFDKIIPSVGYTFENTVLCTHRINSIKRDMTLKEMALWTPDWHSRIVQYWKEIGYQNGYA